MKMIVGLVCIAIGFLCIMFVNSPPVNIFSGSIFVLLGVILLALQEKSDINKGE